MLARSQTDRIAAEHTEAGADDDDGGGAGAADLMRVKISGMAGTLKKKL